MGMGLHPVGVGVKAEGDGVGKGIFVGMGWGWGWCPLLCHSLATKRRQPVFKFTHRSKISIFTTQGRLVAPIQVKFGTAERHIGPLGCAKFHTNRFLRVGTRPQNGKNFHFLAKSRPAQANPFTDFYNC